MAREGIDGPFQRRVVVWLVAVVAGSLALGVGLLTVGPEDDVNSVDADVFSRSALGHRAFASLLRAQGVPVVVSRYDSGHRAGANAVLVLAEPQVGDGEATWGRMMGAMLSSARVVLLVLPKWRGTEDAGSPGWVSDVELVPEAAVTRVMQVARVSAAIARQGRSGAELCSGVETPVTWTHPQLLSPISEGLRPLIACEGGILLGEVAAAPGSRVVVLSDPDILSNHGLGKGDNAALALAIVEGLRRPGQALVLDETLHGHERIPSLWRELFAFPLLPSVLQAALALSALVWSGLGRFGAPVPLAAAIAPGKAVLIENTAALMRSAGHSAYSLGRYLDAAVVEVGRGMLAPAERRSGDLRLRLEAAGRRRRVSVSLKALLAQVEQVKTQETPGDAPVIAAARRVHRWKREMLRGPQDHPSN